MRVPFVFLCLATCQHGAPVAADIGASLAKVPGFIITKTYAPNGGTQRFDFTFTQLLNHSDASSPTFAQRGFLLHRSVSAAVVFETEGYELPGAPEADELSVMLAGNQVHLEHRFFHDNPHPRSNDDWKFLTIQQAAADDHALVLAMKTLYKGNWVTTGASKGGETAVYYRRFYPDDVDATVAYVAPLCVGIADARFPPFIAARYDGTYNAALTAAQRRVLHNRVTFDALLSTAAQNANLSFTLYSPDQALEYATESVPFTLWQYFDKSFADTIPADSTSDSAAFDWIANVGVLLFYDDNDVRYFGPYDYQVDTQLGGPDEDDSQIADLLVHQTDPDPSLPADLATPFDDEAMPDIIDWVTHSSTHIMFIYGENDPWTAGAATLGTGDNVKYIAPSGNHLSTIARLNDADRNGAAAKLSQWLGITVSTPRSQDVAVARDADAREIRYRLHHHRR